MTFLDSTLQLPRASALLRQEAQGPGFLGVQAHIACSGVFADLVFGADGFGHILDAGSVIRWLSATKPLVAVAIAQLWERGRFTLDDPVRRYIPGFKRSDVSGVTLRHLLTHTAGFRDDPPRGGLSDEWDEAVRRACDSGLQDGWVPGRMAVYSTWTSFLLLGEVVRRVDGRSLDQYVREELFLPLGMTDCFLSMSPTVYESYRSRLVHLAYLTPEGPMLDPVLTDSALASHCWPALGARGPARQMAQFFRALMPSARSHLPQLLQPTTLEAVTARHQVGIRYKRFLKDVSWGLGVLSGPEMFGPYCSNRTFGGRGHGSSVVFADPTYDLAVTSVWTVMLHNDQQHGARVRALSSAVYEDLEIAIRVRTSTLPQPVSIPPNMTSSGGPVADIDTGSDDGPDGRINQDPAVTQLLQMMRAVKGRPDDEIVTAVAQVGGPDALLDIFRRALAVAAKPSAAEVPPLGLRLSWVAEEELSYTLQVFPDGMVSLTMGIEENCSLVLESAACDLARMLMKDLDVKAALATGRLRLKGDVTHVRPWLQLFSGSAFALGDA